MANDSSENLEPETARTDGAGGRWVTAASGPSGRPFHPLLVTLPLGAWTCSVIFDVVSMVIRESMWARGAMWLVIIGLAGAVSAAAVGLIDFMSLSAGSSARASAVAHLRAGCTAIGLFAASLAIRRTHLDDLSGGTPVLAFVFSVAGMGALGVSASLGNRLVFTMASRVEGVAIDPASGTVGAGPNDPREPGSVGKLRGDPPRRRARAVHPAVLAALKRRDEPIEISDEE